RVAVQHPPRRRRTARVGARLDGRPAVTGRRRTPRGQALVETGVVIVLLCTLVMGIIEFGRAFLIANMITNAAREGARAAAVVPSTQRDGAGNILDASGIKQLVLDTLQGTVDTSGFTVGVAQLVASGIPTVEVTVNGTVPFVFNLPGVGQSFTVARSVTFRDEGR